MSTPTPSSSSSTNPPPSNKRGGGFGAFIRSLFLMIFSAALGIAGVLALAYYVFGFRPETASQAAQLAALQQEINELQEQNRLLQTQVVEVAGRSSTTLEQAQELEKQVDVLTRELQELQKLGDQMHEYAAVAATVQSEARDSRTAVALSMEVQATRFAQVDELVRRTDRIGRFLERLSDISGDTASDLYGSAVPSTPTPTIDASAESLAPTSTLEALPEPTAETPQASEETEEGGLAPAATPAASSPTRTPTATATRTPTP